MAGGWGESGTGNPSSAQRRGEEKGKRYCARCEDYLVFISLILQLNVSRRLAPGLRITIAVTNFLPGTGKQKAKRRRRTAGGNALSPQNTFLTTRTFSNRRAASSRNTCNLVERRHSVTILTAEVPCMRHVAAACCCCCLLLLLQLLLLLLLMPLPPADCRCRIS